MEAISIIIGISSLYCTGSVTLFYIANKIINQIQDL